MGTISLESFDLESYNIYNIEHKSVIISLSNDFEVKKYLGDLEFMIHINGRNMQNNYDQVYIVYIGSDPIGFVSSSYLSNGYDIRYALLPEYRGFKFSISLLEEFSKYLFNKYDAIDEINLDINERNEASLKTATNVGYKKCGRVNYIIKRDELMKKSNVSIMCEELKQKDTKTYVEFYYTKHGIIIDIIKKEIDTRNPADILNLYDFKMTKFKMFDEVETKEGIKRINCSPMIYFGKKINEEQYFRIREGVSFPKRNTIIECNNGEIIRDFEISAITSQDLIREMERFNQLSLSLKKGQN